MNQRKVSLILSPKNTARIILSELALSNVEGVEGQRKSVKIINEQTQMPPLVSSERLSSVQRGH